MLLYSKTLYAIYIYSGDFFIFLLFVLGLYSLINIKSFKSDFKWFMVLILGYLFFEVLFLVYKYFGITETHFINHPYSFFALIFASIFYSKILNSNQINILIIFTCLIFIGFDCYQIFTSKGPLTSPSIFPVMNFLFILLSSLVYKKIVKSPRIKNTKNESLFWINLGFFITNIFQLILVPLFRQVIPISDDIAFIVGTLKNLADPITYTLWAIGVYKLKTQPFRPIASLWP
ncbi:hypothetical protein EGI22_15190 [Lacihabitans sp. LS3-19]|nr:hypothetical protein [Lacihabitans sp. LS3-19]